MNTPKTVALHSRGNTQMLYFTGSSLSCDDRHLYLISDRSGSPNVYVHDLVSGEERMLTRNNAGTLKSYVYFDGTENSGLGKASVCLDPVREVVYFIQNRDICAVEPDGKIRRLNQIPDRQMTAFTHVSNDGRYLCVPTTDARILDFDPDTQGTGLDKRPVYDIDARVQDENLNSYLHVYDTRTGRETLCEPVPRCWITHVQFHPANSEWILYNNEWPSFDCGIRRMNLFDGHVHRQLRNAGDGRSAADWVCHEMWSPDGNHVIYHGAYDHGPAFVGRYDLKAGGIIEIALPAEYNAYGHFTVGNSGTLVCDGYYKRPEDTPPKRFNSTDFGADPHQKNAEYVSLVYADWDRKILTWTPLCKHGTDWLGQDAHPHAIFNHRGDAVYFSSRQGKFVGVYSVSTDIPLT
ncbi:MAG TPA: hypothetical protein PKU80_00745 [Candidatus Limiplasma sp.]|nr:hypothetical protein [Candidatus Limiplasma sp.]